MKSIKFFLKFLTAMIYFYVETAAYTDRFGVRPSPRVEEILWHRYKVRFRID